MPELISRRNSSDKQMQPMIDTGGIEKINWELIPRFECPRSMNTQYAMYFAIRWAAEEAAYFLHGVEK